MQLSILVLMEDNYLLRYKLLFRCGSTIKFLLADYKAFHYHSHDCWGLCRSQNFLPFYCQTQEKEKLEFMKPYTQELLTKNDIAQVRIGLI